MKDKRALETMAVHAGEAPDAQSGALRAPIHMATSFELPGFGPELFEALMMDSEESPYVYTRWSNPTLRSLEERLCALEGAEAAVATASGMAAVSALLLTVLSGGDHLVSSEVCYAGTLELLGEHLPRFGVDVSFVDTSDAADVEAALRPETKLLYVETPANPTLQIADIGALASVAHDAGVPIAVDSTFAGPVLQRPLDLGVDYVVHSLTKYFNGQGDAVGGVVLGSDERIHRIRREMLVHLGGAMSPFNAWLIMRGIVTLPLRMERHSLNALRVARFLEEHPRVERVFYPGLESHPHHKAATRQMKHFGGMVAFRLRGGLGSVVTLAEKAQLFRYATSLGHAHSLLFFYPTDLYLSERPYLGPSQGERIRAWMGDGLVRASIGLENLDDLIEDLDQALRGRTFRALAAPLAYKLLSR
jgi:cystathionine beta-lyase/cystathionine gamma-synthase